MLNIFRDYFLKLVDKSVKQNQNNILKFTDPYNTHTMIDLGCDDGTWTLQVATEARAQEVHGVEIVKDRAKLAQEKGIKIKVSDLNQKIEYEDCSFDFVLSNQVIEHIKDTDLFVSEIYRILKPNGYTIISTENLSSTHNIFALMLGFQPFSMTNFSSKGTIGNPLALWNDKPIDRCTSWQHNRLFSIKGLQDLLKKHGFIIEGVKTAGYYPLCGFISNIDSIHGHWLTIKARKP